jgi:hypothetical protein
MSVVLSGCAGINAPRGAVPVVDSAPQDAFGGWAGVWETKDYAPTLEGELIALSADSVYLLKGSTLEIRALAGIRRVRVVGYNPRAGDLQTWTLTGALSTLSHGGWSVISMPLWLLTGLGATRGAARVSEINFPTKLQTWENAVPFARFPQGMPAGLDRSSLRRRTVVGGNRR